MASGSFKDLQKTLTNTLAGPFDSIDLPRDLQSSIDAYLAKHEDSDDHDEQRLQEELVSLHARYIVKDEEKLSGFLLVLRALRSNLRGQASLLHWWKTLIKPVLDNIGHTRLSIQSASTLLLDILDYDVEADESGEEAKVSTFFATALLDAYLRRTRMQDLDDETMSHEDNFIAAQLTEVLIAYGKKKTKEFMQAIDRIFVVKEQRLQILGLLNAFVGQQPPYLWHILQTSLTEHLLQCLLLDTSTTVVSLTLTTLIMLLPHIPSSVRKHLPRLFLIYSRLLCWERYRPSGLNVEEIANEGHYAEDSDDEVESPPVDPVTEEVWDKLESSFDAAESESPELMHYFTFLYGLYPLNFMSYIRKSRKYLKKINFPRADEFDLDQKVIRSRSEQFTRLHLLHPNFTRTTIEDELNDDQWLKSDPADVVAECMSLSLTITTLNQQMDVRSTPSIRPSQIPPAHMRTEDIPSESLLGYNEEGADNHDDLTSPTENGSTVSWPNNLSMTNITNGDHTHIETSNPVQRAMMHAQAASRSHSPAFSSPLARPVEQYADSPTLGATLPPLPTPSRTQRNGSIASLQTTTATGTSPRMSPMHAPTRDSLPRSPALRPSSQTESNLSFLQREVTLLKNDLNFERFLKQQHLTHIGRLQRKHVREATIEAETQNLINTNRALKTKLAEANKAHAALKKETATSRNLSKKYEAELTTRMRRLKEDERSTHADTESLTLELRKAQSDGDALRQLVVDSEAKELQARQEVASVLLKLDQLESLHHKLQDLEVRLRNYESRELEFEAAISTRDALARELATLQLRLQSRDADSIHERSISDRRVADLEGRLLAMQNPTLGGTYGQLSPQAQRVVDQAIIAQQGKYNALKKEHNILQHRFLDLEIRTKDLERELTDAKAAYADAKAVVAAARGSTSAPAAMLSSSPNRTRYYGSSSQAQNLNLSSRTSSRRGNSIDEEPAPVLLTPTSTYSRHIPIPIPTRYDNMTSNQTAMTASAYNAGVPSGTPPSSYRDYTTERSTRGSTSRTHGTSPTTSTSTSANPSGSPQNQITHAPMPPSAPGSNSPYNYNPASPGTLLVGSPPGVGTSRALHRTGTLPGRYATPIKSASDVANTVTEERNSNEGRKTATYGGGSGSAVPLGGGRSYSGRGA